jgi:hypothetical protein
MAKIKEPIRKEATIKTKPIGSMAFFFILIKYIVSTAILNQSAPKKINPICLNNFQLNFCNLQSVL